MQICQNCVEGNRDILYMILTTLLALSKCHRCGNHVVERSVNEMFICDYCQLSHGRPKKITFALPEVFYRFSDKAPGLSCLSCRQDDSMSTCFYCKHTSCGISVYNYPYMASIPEPLTMLCTIPHPLINEGEEWILKCAQCCRDVCYECRIKHCRTEERASYFDDDYVFLCHTCRPFFSLKGVNKLHC